MNKPKTPLPVIQGTHHAVDGNDYILETTEEMLPNLSNHKITAGLTLAAKDQEEGIWVRRKNFKHSKN